MTQTPPRWDLSSLYTSLTDPQLQADMAAIPGLITEMQQFYDSDLKTANTQDSSKLTQLLNTLIEKHNLAYLHISKIFAYLSATIATDSFNAKAQQLFSSLQIAMLPFQNLQVSLRAWLGGLGQALNQALQKPSLAREHAFYLLEEAEQARYQMSGAEERLAAELNLSAGELWENLQGTLTSQKTVLFELDGNKQTLSMPALINLRSHPDPLVRERAYKAEMQVWEEMKEPLAACLNGIKGQVNTLNAQRGRQDCLHQALDQARIDRATLEAMQEAIQDSLPQFRRYFQAKAKKLGTEKLPWWSLFAPLGKTDQTYSFEEAQALILENFASFTPELAALARRAFDENWIDAEQRPGKRGGAFCMGVDALEQSRILVNFDGSLDLIMTTAHELGHAFHNHCAYQTGKTPLQTQTPMTLAETASIMNETIMFHALLAKANNPQEELALLEAKIQGDAQTMVDIHSRFIFEHEFFVRRAKAVLSADEISEIMLDAQRQTYGDGLDPKVLNKYAWTWKPHYYSTQLSFYNFPYSFGSLFGTGLYAIYQQRGSSFIQDYKELLASTGEASAADLASRFGIDIRSKSFWQQSLSETIALIDRFVNLQ